MKEAAENLMALVDDLYNRYCILEEGFCSIQLSGEKWSVKEIFGHLIDSAANNYQRFMRLQEGDLKEFPGYGTHWVKLVPYNSCPFSSLISLWREINMLLVHIIRNLPAPVPAHVWKTAEGDMSLEFLVTDYISHMKIHAAHLEERLAELKESM